MHRTETTQDPADAPAQDVHHSQPPGPFQHAAHTAGDSHWQVLFLPLEDPRVTPLITELVAEYSFRYGNRFGGAEQEMRRYPAAEFAAPGGALLVVVENGATVAGGAFRRFDSRTAELKRIWTSSLHRRRGLARFVLAGLEEEALRRGYSRAYLTTGPRQPEARELYLRTGYTPLFDVDADPEDVGQLAFEKDLSTAEHRVAPVTKRPGVQVQSNLPVANLPVAEPLESNLPESNHVHASQLHPNHPTGV